MSFGALLDNRVLKIKVYFIGREFLKTLNFFPYFCLFARLFSKQIYFKYYAYLTYTLKYQIQTEVRFGNRSLV